MLVYWGWYWRQVYDSLPLIGAQLLFAYALRHVAGVVAPRRLYARLRALSDHLQHQPVPVVQAGLVLPAVPDDRGGFAAKELIRWKRDGRRVHIFNPSSFPLAVFSLVLILTGTTDIT